MSDHEHVEAVPGLDGSGDEAIFAEITAERARQNAKWGEQNHPSFDLRLAGRGGQRMAERYEIPTEARAKWLCNEMARRGELTWTDIAVEDEFIARDGLRLVAGPDDLGHRRAHYGQASTRP